MIGHSVNGIDTYYNYRGGAGTDPNAIANYYGIPTGNSDSPVNNIEFLRVIQSQVPGIFSYNGLFTQDGSAYNGLFFFQIKALPSIANNLEVIFSATGENFLIAPDGSDPGAPYRIKFMKRSDVPTHFTLPPVL
jgi:hypothetical protein